MKNNYIVIRNIYKVKRKKLRYQKIVVVNLINNMKK